VFRVRSRAPELEFWPEATVLSESDIVVSGISLLRLAEVYGTPAVHSAAAVIPGSGGRPANDARVAVLVVRIVAVERNASRMTIVQSDARLDNLRLIWSEARMFGRPSSARHTIGLVVRKPGTMDLAATDDAFAVDLPRDLRTGDLLAIPSRGIQTGSVGPLHPLTGRRDGSPDSIFQDGGRTPAPRWESIG
jgi:hypothetical protein